jgi:hypothetical protein
VNPKDKFGSACFLWAVEQLEYDTGFSKFGFGISNVSTKVGDYVQFMDFPIKMILLRIYLLMPLNMAMRTEYCISPQPQKLPFPVAVLP